MVWVGTPIWRSGTSGTPDVLRVIRNMWCSRGVLGVLWNAQGCSGGVPPRTPWNRGRTPRDFYRHVPGHTLTHAPAAGLPARPGGLAAPAPPSRARWAGREGEKNLRSGCCRGPGRGAAGARGGHGAGGDSEVTPLPQTLATERTRFTLTSNVTVKQEFRGKPCQWSVVFTPYW